MQTHRLGKSSGQPVSFTIPTVTFFSFTIIDPSEDFVSQKLERQGAEKSSATLNMLKSRREQEDLSCQSSPCSSGKSASSEPGGSRNKDSVSCLQDISRGAQSTQTEELAQTSKTPDRLKAPLAPRCNKHRSACVTDGVLNGPTQGEASKQTQSQGTLKRQMKHLSSETNIDRITDAKCTSGVWTLPSLEGAIAAPHLSTLSTSSWESEEEETGDDLLGIRHHTQTFSNFTALLRRSRIPCPECRSLELGTSLCPAGVPVYCDGHLQQQIIQPERERSMQRQALPTSLAFTVRPRQRRFPVPIKSQEKEKEKENANEKKEEEKKKEDVQTPGTSSASTLQFSYHNNNQNMVAEVLVHSQEREEDPGGAAAAKYTHQHLKDSSEDIVCRPKQRSSVDLSREENVDLCRICYSSDNSPENPLVSPCHCSGSAKYIHLECLKKWIVVRLQSKGPPIRVRYCEVCTYILRLASFDFAEFCNKYKRKKKGALRSFFCYIGRGIRRMRDWKNQLVDRFHVRRSM